MMKGAHFQLWKKGRRWYWHLHGEGFPSGPIARCREEGYSSKANARSSMQSARHALDDALQDGRFAIDELSEPPFGTGQNRSGGR